MRRILPDFGENRTRQKFFWQIPFLPISTTTDFMLSLRVKYWKTEFKRNLQIILVVGYK